MLCDIQPHIQNGVESLRSNSTAKLLQREPRQTIPVSTSGKRVVQYGTVCLSKAASVRGQSRRATLAASVGIAFVSCLLR